jgi:nucleoside phosphorylase
VHAVDQVGTVPAALTTYLAVQEFKPDLIIRWGAKSITNVLLIHSGSFAVKVGAG